MTSGRGPLEPDAVAVGRGLPPTVVAILASIAGVAPVTLLPIVFPDLTHDLPGFSKADLGIAASVFFLTASALAPLVGRGVDRLGPRRSIRIAGATSAVTVLALAAAPSATMLWAAMVACGANQSLCGTASNLSMSQSLDERYPATLYGLRQATIPAISIVAGSGLALRGEDLDWRVVLVTASVVGLLMLVLPLAVAAGSVRDTSSPPPGLRGSHRPASMLRRLSLLCLVAGFGTSAITTYSVATLTESGLSASAAGRAWLSAAVLGLVVRILLGLPVDRFSWSPVRSTVAMLAVGGVSTASIAVGVIGPEGGIVAVGVIVAFGIGGAFPGLLQLALARLFRGAVGAASGIVQVSIGLGVSLGPLLFSLVEVTLGAPAAWVWTSACYLGAGAVGLLALRAARRTADAESVVPSTRTGPLSPQAPPATHGVRSVAVEEGVGDVAD